MSDSNVNATNKPLIEAVHLKRYFDINQSFFGKKAKILKAVDDVSLRIYRGGTMGLVGESGCGKTTVGRTLVRLYEPTDGKVLYDGQDISHLSDKELLPYRRKMQMIFQDPYASLDPRMTVSLIVGEPLRVQGELSARDRHDRVRELISLVGLSPEHLNRYPHEFSGGQRQRIGIARALAAGPEFIVCDEPISALDVSIQAQVVNMLEDLQARMNLTYLFVSHDLSMVRHLSHIVGVMYLGQLVECAPVEELYQHMQHPYTKALFSAAPVADPDHCERMQRIPLQGDVPTPIDPPSGCPFRTRCAYVKPICAEQRPALRDLGGDHLCACHAVE